MVANIPDSQDTSRLTNHTHFIAATGYKAYFPHQIGITKVPTDDPVVKRMLDSDWPVGPNALSEHNVENYDELDQDNLNVVDIKTGKQTFDHVIEFNGCIIGMALSPDHR